VRHIIITALLAFPITLEAHAGPPDFSKIDSAVNDAIARNELPGAVVLVLHQDKVVFRQAYGYRAVQPEKVKMTADTIFDLASLTKPIATATSIFILLEEGKLKLDDPVAKHWPEFAANGKDKVTIEHCLLHVSGLTADNPLSDYAEGPETAWERIGALKLEAAPGSRFRYSDVGFMVLGHLVEKLSGQRLQLFAARKIFQPLEIGDTHFNIEPPQIDRGAPTTREDGKWLVGAVHDPRARKLGGAAGHAGLFSMVDDLAVFCRMLLHGGELNGKRILKAESVKLMTEPCAVPGGKRTRGWDCDTAFSSNRGTVFPKGTSFGHTGFTGTSIWIDPASETAVIFLSNRVHPDGKGNVTRLRGVVATLAAQALGLQ
jgi:serine-type D-Ala-D-Ala carboxypeptidase